MQHRRHRVWPSARGSAWVLGALAFVGCGGEAGDARLVEPSPAVEGAEPGVPSEVGGADPGASLPEVVGPEVAAPTALDCARDRPACEPSSASACTLSCETRADGCVAFSEFVPLGVVSDGYHVGLDAIDPEGRFVYFNHHWSGGRWEAHPYSWTAAEGVSALGVRFGLSEDPEAFADRYVSVRQVVSDGSQVLGFNIENDAAETGFLWSRAEGVTPLGFEPHSMSADGRVVVGLRNGRAVVWKRDAGLRRLDGGDVDATATAPFDLGLSLSDSGEFALFADASGTIYRWSEASGLTDVRELFGAPAASPYSLTMDASGEVIFGTFGESQNEFREAFRWSESTGITYLGELAGMPEGSGYLPSLVTSDGAVAVGNARSFDDSVQSVQTAFRWTESTGMQPISATASNSQPFYMSPDGSTVIGDHYDETNFSTFRWTERSGTENIEGHVRGGIARQGELLVERTFDDTLTLRKFGSALDGTGDPMIALLPSRPVPLGWSAAYFEGISENGHLLLGSASDPQGERRAWLVRLSQACPE